MPFKQVPSLFHLFAFTALVMIIVSTSSKAQYFDTLEIIPASPTIHDSVFLRRVVTIPTRGFKYGDTLYIVGNTVYSSGCFGYGFQPAFETFVDTFELGKLSAGNYLIDGTVYYSFNQSSCIPLDTGYQTLAFSVINDIGLPEINNGNKINVELYPNPSSSHQQITLYTQIPIPVQINLHSVSGKKVMEVYNGQSVQGQQEFEVDLANLASGVYVYQIQIEDEVIHFKTIKR